MLWQPSNKFKGYPFFRWSFSNLANQSFKRCQEFIDCLSIAKSLHPKLFKCHKSIYSECSGEGALDFCDISSLLLEELQIHSESPTLQIISTCSSHSIIGSSNVASLNSGINHRLKGLLAIAAGFKKSVS